jgi:hypothetical protein
LPTGRAARNANTDGNAFGVVVVAGVVFAGRVGMQEESSAPHTRLGYIHLHSSFKAPQERYRPEFDRITVESTPVKKKAVRILKFACS